MSKREQDQQLRAEKRTQREAQKAAMFQGAWEFLLGRTGEIQDLLAQFGNEHEGDGLSAVYLLTPRSPEKKIAGHGNLLVYKSSPEGRLVDITRSVVGLAVTDYVRVKVIPLTNADIVAIQPLVDGLRGLNLRVKDDWLLSIRTRNKFTDNPSDNLEQEPEGYFSLGFTVKPEYSKFRK